MDQGQHRNTISFAPAQLRLECPGATAKVLPLAPGPNRIGRAASNHIQVDHPTVSEVHCEVDVGPTQAVVRDLGSTNGTFLDGEPIQEAVIHSGQKIHCGEVGFVFERKGLKQQSAPVMVEEGVQQIAGSTRCAHHPKSVALWVCSDCQRVFCSACVKQVKLEANRTVTICPDCQGLCEPLGKRGRARRAQPTEFASGLVSALVYPLKGNGLFMLAGVALAEFALTLLRGYFLLLGLGLGAYLAVFLRSIVRASANGEETVPPWPEWDWIAIREAALEFVGVYLVSFGAWSLWRVWMPPETAALQAAQDGLLALGAFYFPMALLGVIIFDNFAAVNPFHVFLSIAKAPVRYLGTCLLAGAVAGLGFLAETALAAAGTPRVASVVGSLVSLYALMVLMRALGWFYYCTEETLAWH